MLTLKSVVFHSCFCFCLEVDIIPNKNMAMKTTLRPRSPKRKEPDGAINVEFPDEEDVGASTKILSDIRPPHCLLEPSTRGRGRNLRE
jgi:hypothetical protein